MNLVFLGHQSWLISRDNTHILIDPILADRFGSNDGIEIYPPRDINSRGMPNISAIFLSHEHSDHVHLPSLNLLSREAEVIVGVNMIGAVADAVASLGFQVRRQRPFDPFTIGALTATFYPASHATVAWESRVNQFYIQASDLPRPGIFVAVDALVAPEYLQQIAEGGLPPPSAVIVSNNAQIAPPGVFGSLDNIADPKGADAKKGLFGLQILDALLVDYVQGLEGCANVIISGGGFMKGYPELGPFPFSDQRRLANAANELSRTIKIFGPYPGQQFVLDESLSEDGLADFVAFDVRRFVMLEKQSRQFVEQCRSIDMIQVSRPPCKERSSMANEIEAALNEMVPALMLSSAGQLMLGIKDYLSGRVGQHRMAVCAIDQNNAFEAIWSLDVVQAKFVKIPSGVSEQIELVEQYPFGVVVHLQDLYEVVVGNLQIWDIAGVAIRAWFVGDAESSPVAFLYAWFGEHLKPKHYEASYRTKIEQLGFVWRTSDTGAAS